MNNFSVIYSLQSYAITTSLVLFLMSMVIVCIKNPKQSCHIMVLCHSIKKSMQTKINKQMSKRKKENIDV